jgi:inositol transport system substrate-binding protein
MLIDQGYVDATGVQNLFLEAQLTLDAIQQAIADGVTQPNEVMLDPGFALTAGNIRWQRNDMWGCVLYDEGFLNQ